MAKEKSDSIGFGVFGSVKKKPRGKGKPFEKGNPYRIKPGEIRNPHGRNLKPFAQAMDLIARRHPEVVIAVASHMYEAAQGKVPYCSGAVQAAKLVIDRVDGPMAQEVSGPGGGPIQIEHGTSETNATRITDLYARAFERANRRRTIGTGNEAAEG